MGKEAGIKHDAIAMISWGMLLAIAAGLIGGTTYIVTLGNASAEQTKRLEKIEAKQSAIDEMKTDLAVIREKVESIERGLNRR